MIDLLKEGFLLKGGKLTKLISDVKIIIGEKTCFIERKSSETGQRHEFLGGYNFPESESDLNELFSLCKRLSEPPILEILTPKWISYIFQQEFEGYKNGILK